MPKNLVRPALALALSASMLTLPYSTQANPNSRVPEAPNFHFEGPRGADYQLKDLRGSVVVLDFWASWCPACRRSLPQLEALNKKYKDEKVVFIGVNDEDRNTIDEFSQEHKLHFFTIQDEDDKISEAFHVEAIPDTFVIDKDERVVASFEGFDGSDGELDNAIQAALGEN